MIQRQITEITKHGAAAGEAGRPGRADWTIDQGWENYTPDEHAEAAAARQAAADRELRDKLLAAANGNFQPGLGLDDVGPIKEVLKTVPLDRVIMTIRQKVDRRSYPANPPLVSWRDPAFLRAIAEDFCRAFAVPGLVREWGAAGKAPATKATGHQDGSPVGAPPAPDMAMRAPGKPENAPAAPPPQPAANPNDGPAIGAEPASVGIHLTRAHGPYPPRG